MRSVLIAPLLLLLATPAVAQQMVPVMMKVSSGTGFYVTRQGDVITNAHVIHECKTITVKTATGEIPATLQAIDTVRDLALLRVSTGTSPAVASLRWDIRDLRVGNSVVVMGYPGQEGLAGHYVFRKSTVTDLKGPVGEAKWLQLTTVAQHGNSGGPVLDEAGNVIAVITGNSITAHFQLDAEGKRVGQPVSYDVVSVGITLPVLEDFLREHGVNYFQASSGNADYADILIERRANRFILPIRCYQGAAT